ncbi:hypothetical protein HK098_008024 [Nowakowskiella sp. JEL0407]|nr:hypothetical protein HK098_008024 [Nowakowskiella sp. JEL0407]
MGTKDYDEIFTSPAPETILCENEGLIVPFVGSAISLFAPTFIPTWWSFIKSVITNLADACNDSTGKSTQLANEILKELDSGTFPPYKVTEIVSRRLGVDYLEAISAFEVVFPNHIHFYLARGLLDGRFPALITTNFDRAIESAVEFLGGNVCFLSGDAENDAEQLDVLFEKLQGSHSNDRGVVVIGSFLAFSVMKDLLPLVGGSTLSFLIKIHGDAGNPASCIDTEMQRHQGLPLEVKTTLYVILRRFKLFFMGFSGVDIEGNLDYLSLKTEKESISQMFWLTPPEFKEPPVLDQLRNEIGEKKIIAVSGGFVGNFQSGFVNPIVAEKLSSWASDTVGPFWASLVLVDLARAAKLPQEIFNLGIKSAFSALTDEEWRFFNSSFPHIFNTTGFLTLRLVMCQCRLSPNARSQLSFLELCAEALDLMMQGDFRQAIIRGEDAIRELRYRFRDIVLAPNSYLAFAVYAVALKALNRDEDALKFMEDARDVAWYSGNLDAVAFVDDLLNIAKEFDFKALKKNQHRFSILKSNLMTADSDTLEIIEKDEILVSVPLFDNAKDLSVSVPASQMYRAHLFRALMVGDRVAISPNFLLDSKIFLHEVLFANNTETEILLPLIRPMLPRYQEVVTAQGSIKVDLFSDPHPILRYRNECQKNNIRFLNEEIPDRFIEILDEFYTRNRHLIAWYEFSKIAEQYEKSVLQAATSKEFIASLPLHLQGHARYATSELVKFVNLCTTPSPETMKKRALFRSSLYNFGNLFKDSISTEKFEASIKTFVEDAKLDNEAKRNLMNAREEIANKPWRYAHMLHRIADEAYINNIPNTYGISVVGRSSESVQQASSKFRTKSQDIGEISVAEFPAYLFFKLTAEELKMLRNGSRAFRVALRGFEKDGCDELDTEHTAAELSEVRKQAGLLCGVLRSVLIPPDLRPLVRDVFSGTGERNTVADRWMQSLLEHGIPFVTKGSPIKPTIQFPVMSFPCLKISQTRNSTLLSAVPILSPNALQDTFTPIKQLEEIEMYKNRSVSVRSDRVFFTKSKKEGRVTVVVEGGNCQDTCVVVIPIIERLGRDGKSFQTVVMARQFRYPVSAWSWEFPRGFCEVGVSIEDQATKEVGRETGMKKFKRLTRINGENEIWNNNGISRSKTVYFAVVTETDEELSNEVEVGEDGEKSKRVQVFDVETMKKMVCEGHIRDQFSVSAFSLAILTSCLHS